MINRVGAFDIRGKNTCENVALACEQVYDL
ncbi:hypothetical protein HNR15_000170 [Allobranchiibius huperziae]|uniref:Uncharacterized protein n=1 Tax=Allobranchiibius huperziae TaxID=1874116 RepID=A0A853D9D1_9MICO|nr:hypothetical protein [Allobranchiibius huperziae]